MALAILTAVTNIAAGSAGAPPARAGIAPAAVAPAAVAVPGLDAYQGLGAWIDIYDRALFARPEAAVEAVARRGARTLYLETSNFRMPVDVVQPRRIGRFLDAAKARGLRVVAWYVPGMLDPPLDLRRSLAAMAFRSPRGNRFDSFALDIESTLLPDVAERNRRVLALSARIREAVGPAYPLGAIVLSPAHLSVNPNFWPGFPFRELARTYDVFLPMGYWSFRVHGYSGARAYTLRGIDGLRRLTGVPALPIHPIGGIADRIGPAEARAFVRAVRERGALGGSLYDVGTSDAADWWALRDVAPTPRQDPPSPMVLGRHFGAYGNVPGVDVTHPREVFFRVGRRSGSWELDYEGFDVDAGEVGVLVNWRRVATLRPGPAGWTARSTLALPKDALDRPVNTVAFVTPRRLPPWSVWGVRRVALVPAPLPSTDRAPHGNIPGAERTRAARATYLLPAARGPLTVTVRGHDIAPGEVVVRANNTVIATLAPTAARRWGEPQVVVVPAAALRGDGTDRLSFVAARYPPEITTWGVRLLSLAPLRFPHLP